MVSPIVIASVAAVSYLMLYLAISKNKTSQLTRFGGGFLLSVFLFAALHEILENKNSELTSKWGVFFYFALAAWSLFYFGFIKRNKINTKPRNSKSKNSSDFSISPSPPVSQNDDNGIPQYKIKSMIEEAGIEPDSGAIGIKRAFRIKDIVTDSVQDEGAVYGLYKNSSLRGLSIFEIDIALKVFIAEIYRQYPETEEGFLKMKKIVGHCGVLFTVCVLNFRNTVDIFELKSLDPESEEFKEKFSQLMRTDSIKNNLEALTSPLETHESFLNFCKYIGKSSPEYWERVYSHIGVFYHPGLIN